NHSVFPASHSVLTVTGRGGIIMPSMANELKKKRQKEQEGQEAKEKARQFNPRGFRRRKFDQDTTTSMWLVSFTDVMALMLTFFVLLFAMSNPKKEDWEDFTTNVKEQFSRYYGLALNAGQQDSINIQKVNFEEARDLRFIQQLMNEQLEQVETLRRINVIPQPPNAERPSRLIVSLPSDLLFESGSAAIRDEGSSALFDLQVFLDRIPNRLEVIGHADPRPIPAGSEFPSNWELSLTRAASVAAALENYGYGKDLTMRGQSSGRFQELPDDLTTSEKLSLSRRVDIVIFPDTGERLNIFEFQ
ncbi:MAG: flagellar motor protein MotB, partial [Pseudomonadota bacterium]